MRTVLLAIVLAAAGAAQPRFEVASVKRGGDVLSTRPTRDPGRIRWTTDLCRLIGFANGLDSSRVSGPKCGDTYSIEATFAPSTTDDDLRHMLGALLGERFGLRLRRVVVEEEGYGLIVAKRGKAKEATAEGESYVSAIAVDAGTVAIHGRRATMSQLAATLERVTTTPFWDRTGLDRNYDFSFRFAQGLSADADPAAPGLGTALQESLGLKLQKQKGSVETLVIEQVEEPSGN